MAEPIAVFTNEADGLEASVLVGEFGLHVVLKDTDAGAVVPMVQCFPESAKDRALAYAASLVDVDAPVVGRSVAV